MKPKLNNLKAVYCEKRNIGTVREAKNTQREFQIKPILNVINGE